MAHHSNEPAARSTDLHAIVRIGNGIREVVDAAREVNLAALNAMLSSRRGGDSAVGFRVASAELRGVSSRIMEAMHGLTALVSGMVGEVAQRQRRQRNQACFQRARDKQVHVAGRLAEILGDQKAEMVRLNLSRSALIEAAYGGESAPALRQVAEQLARSIHAVANTLGGVRAEVEEAGA